MSPSHAAIEMMAAKLRGPLTLDDLSSQVKMSKFNFIRNFRRATGASPHAFLAALRMDRAKHLLVEPGTSVTDVAAEVGYESMGTFSHTFHRMVGYCPSEFQKRVNTYSGDQFFSDSLDYSRRERERKGKYIEGSVNSSATAKTGLFFIGAFDRAIPKGKPLAGCILLGPGRFKFVRPPIKKFFVLALWLPFDVDPFFPARHTILGVSVPLDIEVALGLHGLPEVRLNLRSLVITDPPVVVALPALLNI